MIHITCSMGSQDLPDMYALSPQEYISVKSLLPILQLIIKECSIEFFRVATMEEGGFCV